MNNPFINQSVSVATLRTQDLLSAFVPALEMLGDLNKDKKVKKRVIRDGKKFLEVFENPGRRPDLMDEIMQEEAGYFLNEDLFDELNRFAPEGYYFGATEGDGADFGFWKNTDDYDFPLQDILDDSFTTN